MMGRKRGEDAVAVLHRPEAVGAAPVVQRVLPAGAAGRQVRVLHVLKYFRPDFTGEGLYWEKMASCLAPRLVSCSVAASRTQPHPTTRYSTAIGTPALFGAAAGGQDYINPRMLGWFLRRARGFDVVHFHSAVDRHFAFHAIAQAAGCHVVQSCTLDDGLGQLVAGYRPAYRGIVRHMCRLIDDVVAISPALHADSLEVLPPERVHLIPQGTEVPEPPEPAARAAARAQWGIDPDDKVLLFVGGLCARKDVRLLVEQHARLADQRCWLVIVGPDMEDDYAAGLRALVAASPARARIRLVGYLDRPAVAYLLADAFVFASTREGFGNVLLEAMAFGLPVVSRRLPGVTDYFIEHGRTGLLFESADEYVAQVDQLLAQPALRMAMGRRARESVIARFDLPTVARRYETLYRSRIAERSR